MNTLKFQLNDGGRSSYFQATSVGDCVTRAVAIVTGKDYKQVYDEIAELVGYSPRNGISGNDDRKVMSHFGGRWVPKMSIGSGCKCHLRAGEIPMKGRLVCSVSKHVVAVIDGTIHDTFDCSREGNRCVYGYWLFDSEERRPSTIEQQYRELKEKHPDAMLIFRCGDFYELREEDAEKASKLLGILLSRHTMSQQLYCAFPHHALDMYLPKLVRAGYRIAICDPLPAKTTKI